MLNEKRLLRRAKQGCRDSVRQIYEMYSDQMLTLANALLNDIAAGEDVVHDVFVKFSQSLDEFKLKKTFDDILLHAHATLHVIGFEREKDRQKNCRVLLETT